jgi:hypothetical protein
MGSYIHSRLTTERSTSGVSARTRRHVARRPRLQERGLRYDSPPLGRWMSRDPLGDHAFLLQTPSTLSRRDRAPFIARSRAPVYLFTENSPIDRVDILGLFGGGGVGGPGHGDFPGSTDYDDCYGFDFNAEDEDWHTSPFWPWGTWRHFRSRDEVESDLDAMLGSCDASTFERLMHQGQDTFSHYDNDWQWYPTFGDGYPMPGHPPQWWPGDYPDDDTEAFVDAATWTQNWLDQWNALCCKHECECKWVSRTEGPCKE